MGSFITGSAKIRPSIIAALCRLADCFVVPVNLEVSMSIFTNADLIHVYSRAQAIADGGLIDVTETAKEAGFRIHTALTAAVWGDCVDWDERYEKAYQDEAGCLWDVLIMALHTARTHRGSRAEYTVFRIPRGGLEPEPVRLVLHVGPGDEAEPVVTIMQPGED
jgi:hypothetical protein